MAEANLARQRQRVAHEGQVEILEGRLAERSVEELAEEVADLLILLMGTAIAANFDLKQAFWKKMDKLIKRETKMVNCRIRVSEFKYME